MKRYAGVVALVLVAAMCSAANAQRRTTIIDDDSYIRVPHRFTITFDGGLAIPNGPGAFSDAWATTFPLDIGVGVAVFSWFDVNVVYSRTNFALITLDAKRNIAFLGVDEIVGGDISTTRYYGSARFIAVPEHQLNPFVEIGFGYYKTTAEDLVVTGEPPNSNIKVSFTNRMKDMSGLAMTFGLGTQYALNRNWSAYTKFMWNINSGGDFAPSNLIRSQNGALSSGDGDQQFANLVAGLMIRF